MINRIERPLANDHPDGSFSVHLFLHRPKTQISRIIGQYTHNLLGLKTLSFSVLLFIHKNMDKRSPNWVRHAKCTWSSFMLPWTSHSRNCALSVHHPQSCHVAPAPCSEPTSGSQGVDICKFSTAVVNFCGVLYLISSILIFFYSSQYF